MNGDIGLSLASFFTLLRCYSLLILRLCKPTDSSPYNQGNMPISASPFHPYLGTIQFESLIHVISLQVNQNVFPNVFIEHSLSS